MFARSMSSMLVVAGLCLSLASTGCLTDVLAPERPSEYANPQDPSPFPGTKIGPGDALIEPCAPSVDLVPNGRIDASDLALFASHERKQNLAADFTENGVVNEFDRRVLEFHLGRPYTHDCERRFSLPAGCYTYANPDMNGSGWIDASDLAAFLATRSDPARADFNGDGAVDAIDQVILEERLGQAFTAVPCVGTVDPCAVQYPNPDLNGDGVISSSDLPLFAAASASGDLSADFTGNGVVNGYDLDVIEHLLGQTYQPTCGLPKWMLAEGCHAYASPDINGSGWVDASDLAVFYSTVVTVAQADFNGDGVVDWSDAIILLDRFGTAYTDPSCSEI